MEKLIALIVATVVGVGGSVVGLHEIQQAANREGARTNLVMVLTAARQAGQLAELVQADASPEAALQQAFRTMDGDLSGVTIDGTRVTSVMGDFCFQAVMADIDSRSDVFECAVAP